MIIPQEDFADLVSRMDSYKQLYAAMDKLTEVQRRRLSLYYFSGMTYREIADSEDVAHSAVIRSVQQALCKLRKYHDN